MRSKQRLSDDFDITEHCVEREIREAHIFSILLFDLVNPLYENDSLILHSRGVLGYMQRSFMDSYVMSLCKLYADSKEHGLIHLINGVQKTISNSIDIRLERVNPVLRTKTLAARTEFKTNFGRYIKKINTNRSKVKELRNIFRAHNLPEKEVVHDVTYLETKQWLKLAEEIYKLCLECTGKTASGSEQMQPDHIYNGSRYFLRHLNSQILSLESKETHWSDKYSKLKIHQ